MVSVAQRDVLLELAKGGIALTKDFDHEDPKVKKDRKAMIELWRKFMDSEDDELDFYKCVEDIQAVRENYKRK